MVTGARRSIILLALACCGVLAQDASALTTEVSLQPSTNPSTKAPTASLSVIADRVPSDCTRMIVYAQTRERGERPSVTEVTRVRLDPARNTGRVTLRFRYLATRSSGKTEKVNFQVNCTNSAGVKTVSQSNAGTLNKCGDTRVVRGLADAASDTKAAIIY